MRALALLLLLLAVAGCGPTQKCGPGNCSGCCDTAGTCQTGNSNAACGTGGLLCGTCSAGLNCNIGICGSAGSGGGTGGGGGGTGGGGGGTGGGAGGTGGGSGGGATGGGSGGGVTGGGSGGGSGSTFETWCANYITGVCDFAVRCGLYSSATACRASAGTSGFCATTPAMRDGRAVFDSTAAANCLSLLNGACDAVDLMVCATTLRGTGALNAACYADWGTSGFPSTECVAGLYCNTTATCPGVCNATTPVGQPSVPGVPCAPGSEAYGSVCVALTPVGQSCAPTGGQTSDRTCVADAFCSSTKVCTAKRLMGQTCTSYGQCGGMLQCYGGACGRLGALAAPCDSTRQCMGDLYCGTTNVCVARGTINTACSSAFGQCESSLVCDIPSGSMTGTCQPTRTLGQACTYSGYQCGFSAGLYCTATSTMMSGVCAMTKGSGASCLSYVECTSGNCVTGMCANTANSCIDPTP